MSLRLLTFLTPISFVNVFSDVQYVYLCTEAADRNVDK